VARVVPERIVVADSPSEVPDGIPGHNTHPRRSRPLHEVGIGFEHPATIAPSLTATRATSSDLPDGYATVKETNRIDR
jgi:hypothetical protein